jgi:hypothetical protein
VLAGKKNVMLIDRHAELVEASLPLRSTIRITAAGEMLRLRFAPLSMTFFFISMTVYQHDGLFARVAA